MKNTKPTLLYVLRRKESIHWKRTKDMFLKFNGWGARLIFGTIAVIIGTIYHYMLASMSTLYECTLYIFNRPMYRANIIKMVSAL